MFDVRRRSRDAGLGGTSRFSFVRRRNELWAKVGDGIRR